MKSSSRTHTHHGFTLVEILFVMTIIIILAGLTLGGLLFVKAKQKNNQADIQINLLAKAIQEYHLDNGDYPGDEDAGGTNGEGESNMLFRALYYDGFEAGDDGSATIYLSELDPVTDPQKWIDGTGATSTIIDPWGAEYRYRRGSGAMNPDYDLWTTGPDGAEPEANDKDDISNF